MEHVSFVTLHDRGHPLTFAIRPMRALQLETWLTDVAAGLPPDETRPSAENPLGLAAYLLKMGVFCVCSIDDPEGESIRERLLNCCSLIDETSGKQIPCTVETIETYIGDVVTLILLRKASLHVNLSFAAKGGRKTMSLPAKSAYLRSTGDYTRAKVVNVPPISASVISQGLASLHDLRTAYTFADALDMLEIANARNYNQWASQEAAAKKRSRHP